LSKAVLETQTALLLVILVIALVDCGSRSDSQIAEVSQSVCWVREMHLQSQFKESTTRSSVSAGERQSDTLGDFFDSWAVEA